MSNSVVSNVPKSKNNIRIRISGAVMALRYTVFWTRVFVELNLEMDSVFRSIIRARDKEKNAKRVSQRNRKGKVKQRGKYCSSMSQSCIRMNNIKTGKTYGSEVALKEYTKGKRNTYCCCTQSERLSKGTVIVCLLPPNLLHHIRSYNIFK